MLDRSETLLELADEIDSVLQILQNENNAIHHYELLYRQLSFYESRPNNLNYRVYQKEKIIAPYLLTHWILCSRETDNYNMLQAISKKIRRIFAPSTNVGISESAVHQLMGHIEQRFGYCSKVLNDKPLRIIITEDAYKDGNSLFMTCSIKSKEYEDKRDLVILSRVNENGVPEYAFLHELGHILHLRLTQEYSEWTAPKSFDFIQQIMFKSLADQSQKIWVECFADCFAIAVLHRSPYSELDFYTQISEKDKNLIVMYMDVLFSTLDYNKLGKRTWEELSRHRNKQINQNQRKAKSQDVQDV